MGTMILAAASSTTSKSNPAFTFVILAVLVVLFYVLIMRPQRNRQRKAAQTQNQVMPGQRVRTTAGMYGTVISGDDRDVVVEIAPGVHVTMLRRAIMEVVPEDDSHLGDTMTGGDPFGHAEEPAADDESGHEDTPADDWDIKDRN